MSLIDLPYGKLKKPLVEIFDFKVEPGDVIKIDGQSGMGKSSFFRSLVGLKKIEYKNWRIDSKERKDLKLSEIRQNILYLPQFVGQENRGVKDFIERVLEDKTQVCFAYIEQYQLEHLLDRKLEDLSGGEAQLLNLCLALVLERKVLLLDESFSAIDSKRCEDISRKIIDTYKETKAIAYISHQPLLLDNYLTKRYLIEKTGNEVHLRKVYLND